jgi:hypothetical protein
MKNEDIVWVAYTKKGDGVLTFLEVDCPERACILVFTSRKKVGEYAKHEGLTGNILIKSLTWGQVVALAIKCGLDIRIDKTIDGGLCERVNIGKMLADMNRVRLSYN